jgi:hypothetical protein
VTSDPEGGEQKKFLEWPQPELSRGTRHCASRMKLVIDQRVFRNSSWKCQDNGLVAVVSCSNAWHSLLAVMSNFLVYQQDSPATEIIMQQCRNGIIQHASFCSLCIAKATLPDFARKVLDRTGRPLLPSLSGKRWAWGWHYLFWGEYLWSLSVFYLRSPPLGRLFERSYSFQDKSIEVVQWSKSSGLTGSHALIF